LSKWNFAITAAAACGRFNLRQRPQRFLLKQHWCILSVESMVATAKSTPAPSPDKRQVLTKAVVRAARALGLSQARVASTLGVSDPTASRMFAEKYFLDPQRKEWELAALLVRLFRSLDSIVGSEEKARAWLHSENTALGARPVDLLASAQGLIRVLFYLDAARGRL
jgi:hypothetical protein